jgi:hypothetical protein
MKGNAGKYPILSLFQILWYSAPSTVAYAGACRQFWRYEDPIQVNIEDELELEGLKWFLSAMNWVYSLYMCIS